MEITILKKLGLSDKEIQVYLTLLELNDTSVRKIAAATNLNRGTVYDILKNLQKLGLASFYHKDTKQHFVAEDPSELSRLLATKENELKSVREKIEEVIPQLKLLKNSESSKPVTKFYEGSRGIKFILNDVILSMKNDRIKEYYVYSAHGVREDVYAAYPDFNKKRIKEKIKALTISLSPGGSTYGLDERKWLASGSSGSPIEMTYILIYTGKCAFISRDSSGTPLGVIIENKMIYETQKNIFMQLWNLLK